MSNAAGAVPQSRLEWAQQLANSDFSECRAKQQSLQATITLRWAGSNTASSQIASLEESVRIVREPAANMEQLIDRKFVSRHEFLNPGTATRRDGTCADCTAGAIAGNTIGDRRRKR